MTQIPIQPGTTVNVIQAPTNGLGLSSFITSIVGWVTCGFLCPIGLILGLIALSKPPRGFAIAGVVLGALGSVFLAVFGFAIVATIGAALFGIGAATTAAVGAIEQVGTIVSAQNEVQDFYTNESRLPTPDEAATLFTTNNIQLNGVTPQYKIVSETKFKIILPGIDGQFGTSDDYETESEAFGSGWQSPSTDPSQ